MANAFPRFLLVRKYKIVKEQQGKVLAEYLESLHLLSEVYSSIMLLFFDPQKRHWAYQEASRAPRIKEVKRQYVISGSLAIVGSIVYFHSITYNNTN